MEKQQKSTVVDFRDATIARKDAQITALEDKIKVVNLDNAVLTLALLLLKSQPWWFRLSPHCVADAYREVAETVIRPLSFNPNDFGLNFDRKQFLEQFAD